MPRLLIGNIKGTKGDTGAQGERGLAGTIEVGSVQTVSYGSAASVTNSGTETEAILDFQIPQGAPGATVTDMSNLVLSSITDTTADYPAFAVGETGSTIFGKIRKFLSDLKEKFVSKSMMTASTNVDTEGQYVADAKAINSLNTSLANLSDSLANKAYRGQLAGTIDDNTLESGVYTLRGSSATGTFPSNDAKYSVLVVINRSNSGFQLLYTATEVYTRSITASTLTAEWTSHIHTITTAEVTQTANIAAGFVSVTCTQPSGTHKAKLLISAYVRTSADVVMQGILPSTGTARFYNGGTAQSNATVVGVWMLID